MNEQIIKITAKLSFEEVKDLIALLSYEDYSMEVECREAGTWEIKATKKPKLVYKPFSDINQHES
jgi:hypothetical protein